MIPDETYMKRSLELSLKARIIAPPNPWVGCVLVRKGKIVGEGFTQEAGKEHAEAVALKQAKNLAKGATAYVTLEPCNHFGRTPPCTQALIEARVARVVISLEDPDPQVKGKGIKALKQAGIDTTVGVCTEEAEACLRPYIHQRTTKTPYTVLKVALSADGKYAAKDRTSQWITSEAARQDGHRVRAESQAILIGSGTARTDRPRLTVRNQKTVNQTPLLRAILDSSGQIAPPHPLLDTKEAPTLLFTSETCPPERIEEWKKAGATVELLSYTKGEGLSLQEVLSSLGKRGIIQLLVEGGSAVQGSFLRRGLAQKLIVYTGTKLIGAEGLSPFTTFHTNTLAEALPLKLLSVNLVGEKCVKTEYALHE